ncbi:MAG: oligosaccharide repeat unit polymerase [Ignavibacteriaceae bacterium]|nr:oligosaccharide repeat unit polymerase [Ignavibacteriaceae bacterium]
MPVISFVCLLAFLLILSFAFRKNADILSPGRIFLLLWLLILGLVELKFSRLQSEWDLFDWSIVLLGLLTFLTGIFISYIINLDKPFLPVSKIRLKFRELEINESRLFKFIIIYFFVCLVSFVIEWQIEGYIPLFTSKPDSARVMFGVYGLHYIVNSINVVLFLIIQYFIFVKSNFTKKFVLVLIFILSLGNYILFVQRFGLFILFMMAFCLYYYSGKKLRIRSVILFLVILLGLIIGIQSLRATQLFSTYIYVQSEMKFSPRYLDFTLPYMYLSMNLENFVKYYSNIQNHSFGFFTFEYLIEASTIRKWFIDYYNFNRIENYIGGYNTYPFFWTYYLDFGIAGLALMPFIIGFIFSEIYYFFHRNPTLVKLALVSIAFAVIMISFNSDALSRLDTVLPFTVIVLAQFLFMKRETAEN